MADKETGTVQWFKNGFGRVSRADGTSVFMPPGTFPKGSEPSKGDTLKFAVTNDPKKPGEFIATDVEFVKKAPAPTPEASNYDHDKASSHGEHKPARQDADHHDHPATKPVPAATAAKNSSPPDFEVISPRGPRANGSFMVRVITRVKGKPKQDWFMVLPPRAVSIRTLSGEEKDEQADDHEWRMFVTGAMGIAELFVEFTGTQVTLEFKGSKNQLCFVDLVKPRHMVRAVRPN